MSSYKGRVLLVDDDQKIREFYAAIFGREGYFCTLCPDLLTMRESLSKHSYDAVFLDLNLGAENGLDGLPYVLKTAPFSKVFILTSQNSIDKAVRCMERGASWYFTKGTEPAEIVIKMEALLKDKKPTESSGDRSWRDDIIGDSPAIRATCDTIEKLSHVDSTVLVLGESGTGKEVVSRAIHQSSTRSSGRFEAINCGAIPENLLESELFGHKKGAFTDAKQDRKGIFEICSQGTLLLDEIGDMPANLQTKLLRVLQEKKVTPIGSASPLDIKTRVIAATHRDVMDEVKSGRFREDLFYRLSVVVLEIPALRHRKEDIPLLVNHFLTKFNKRFDKTLKQPSQMTINRLKSYDWPGNIRELQNAIERGVVLAGNDELSIENMFSHLNSVIKREEIPEQSTDLGFYEHHVWDLPLTDAKQLFEKSYIERLLKLSKGNVAELARRSGRYRADLYRMLERYGIDVEDFRKDD